MKPKLQEFLTTGLREVDTGDEFDTGYRVKYVCSHDVGLGNCKFSSKREAAKIYMEHYREVRSMEKHLKVKQSPDADWWILWFGSKIVFQSALKRDLLAEVKKYYDIFLKEDALRIEYVGPNKRIRRNTYL